jgi:multisubunit Na+/H+ antiporter MnhC subunit
MKDKILDILTAVVIGLALAVGALAYFDVLTK